uniref:Ergosterol biosynthetic protein 28 n=1 Tax=Setaria italica TaxID=4555 RepID=K4AFU1_SETIT
MRSIRTSQLIISKVGILSLSILAVQACSAFSSIADVRASLGMASVAVGKKRRVPALGWWLMVVGTVRLAFTWSCFFGSAALCSATYSQAQVSDVHGRTVGVWTLLSCTLCFLCAFNLDNKPLCLATFLSFVYAYGYFVVEYLVYHSVGASTLAALGFFAGILLMVLVQRLRCAFL